MNYYKIYDLNGNPMGVINTLGLRYYNPNTKRMVYCNSDKIAQYIYLKDKYYRPDRLAEEHLDMINHFPKVEISYTTQEEFEKYRDEMNKENLE